MHLQGLCTGLKHFNVNFSPLTPAPGWLTHPSHFFLPTDYRGFQIAWRSRWYSPPVRGMESFIGGNYLLMRSDFKYRILTLINIKINMACVYKENDLKIKMVQEPLTLSFSGRGRGRWWMFDWKGNKNLVAKEIFPVGGEWSNV